NDACMSIGGLTATRKCGLFDIRCHSVRCPEAALGWEFFPPRFRAGVATMRGVLMPYECKYRTARGNFLRMAGILGCTFLLGCTSGPDKGSPLNLFHDDWRYSCASGYYDCALGSRGDSNGGRR
ncbi:MAG: hypothetical protein ACRECY_08140, partial [Phyllobacterium sp.]